MAYHGVELAAARANGAEREAIPESCEARQRFGRPAEAHSTVTESSGCPAVVSTDFPLIG
jgi:hypothetical protein